MARRPSACPLLPYTTLFRSMILHVHGEVLLARLERHALGHGPTDQGAVLLEAEIVVKPSRVMALDDEDRLLRLLPLPPEGFRSLFGVPLALVLGEFLAGHLRSFALRGCLALLL